MKTMVKTYLLFAVLNPVALVAQEIPRAGIYGIESQAEGLSNKTFAAYVLTSLEETGKYRVVDFDQVNYRLRNEITENDDCISTDCLAEAGKKAELDYVISGFVENRNNRMVITLRNINVREERVDEIVTEEFANLPLSVDRMVRLGVCRLLGFPYDAREYTSLKEENTTSPEEEDILHANGPRVGCVAYSGSLAELLKAPKKYGGYDAFPVMSQFGYQFEKQYLNAGKYTGLFEFLPMITGLDQGLFLPGLTFMHGLRNNANGWEFAIGPTFTFITKARGYYTPDGMWHLSTEWKGMDTTGFVPDYTTRMDSRGYVAINSACVLAIGKTFTSGKLNIPFNAFVIPGRHGWRFGVSFGFNARKNKFQSSSSK